MDKVVRDGAAFDGGSLWVSGEPYEYGADDAGYYDDHRNHVLFGTFEAADSLATGPLTLRVAALGFFRAYVNGSRVGGCELLGEWTDYTKRVYYRDLDVSGLVRTGMNVVAIEMGNGWYNPSPLTLFGKYDLRRRLKEVGTPKVRVELFGIAPDGARSVVLSSDSSWRWCGGQLLFNNVYLGERHDLRGPNPAEAPRLEGLGLLPVTCSSEGRLCCPAPHPACARGTAIRVWDVRQVELPHGGTALLADAGQMVTGFARLVGASRAGDVWRLSFAEALGPDGLPCYDTNLAGLVGMTKPGRAVQGLVPGGPGAPERAVEQDVVVCGEGQTSFEGRFCVHSFRYVLIEGLEAEDLEELVCTPVHTGLVASGSLTCGNVLLDGLVDAAVRTKLNNVHGIWEDCARERLGYGGDIVALIDSNLLAFDCSGLLRRTVHDFRDGQTAAGGVPETAPYMGIQSNGTGQGEGPLLWQLAYPYLQLKAWQYYGDRDLVVEEWPHTLRFVDYLLGWDPEELSHHCLGDHGSVLTKAWKSGTPDKDLAGWAAILWIVRTVARLARVVGDEDAEARLDAAAEGLVGRIRRRFVHEDGTIGDDTQTAWAFAGGLGIVDQGLAGSVLARKFAEEGDVLSTGIFGTKLAFEVLHHTGHDDVVEAWLLRRDDPSYEQMLADGSGALHEEFGKGGFGQGSLNHAMFSSYLQWMYQALGGIEVASDAVGADHVLVAPYLAACSQGATASYRTPRGDVRVCWERRDDGGVLVRASWPAGLRVDVHVPRGWVAVGRSQDVVGATLELARA